MFPGRPENDTESGQDGDGNIYETNLWSRDDVHIVLIG